MQPCWELYQQANAYYQADVPGISNAAARKCTVLRTYKDCLAQIDTSGCAGALGYQGTRRVLQSEFRKYNCTEEGPKYPDGPEPDTQPEEITPCKYNGRPIYSYCALFGDPHLVTFKGDQTTCKLEGAWPLVDNAFFTVQVTNAPLSASTKAATATVTHKVSLNMVIECLLNQHRLPPYNDVNLRHPALARPALARPALVSSMMGFGLWEAQLYVSMLIRL